MPITIQLGKSMEKRLDKLARATGHTKTYYIRQALEEKMDDLEDQYIAEHRLVYPESERLSLEEIERGVDLNR